MDQESDVGETAAKVILLLAFAFVWLCVGYTLFSTSFKALGIG